MFKVTRLITITILLMLCRDLQASTKQTLHLDKMGEHVVLPAGTIDYPIKISADYVTLVGHPSGTTFDGAIHDGKGPIVISGNNAVIENINCKNIQVGDQNGSCVRLHGQGLTLRNVHFYDSQQGLLTGDEPGTIFIENSRFENLGKAGRAHAIYVGGGELYIHNSVFLASKDEGHAVKSRAARTVITNSTIASLAGRDSRLIDVPDGGILTVKNSVLEQGPNTSNWNLIGYGMEKDRYPINEVTITNNIIIAERPGSSRLWETRKVAVSPMIYRNVLIGRFKESDLPNNIYIESRQQAGLQPFPYLPPTKP